MSEPDSDSDPAYPNDFTPCERCGKVAPLTAYSGWRHEAGECEWLCEDCHEIACVEE